LDEEEEERNEEEDIKDSSNIQLTGYSPGTRRKQQQNVGTAKLQESGGDDSDQIDGQQQFHRHNSLQPGRCSRRASSGGRAAAAAMGGGRNYPKLPVVPEFLSNTLRPNIRLKAQSLKRVSELNCR